jgi:hypothetical protein
MKILKSSKNLSLDEFLRIPAGMSVETYQNYLAERSKLVKKLAKLSSNRDFLLDGLDILSDEEGSDRWEAKRSQLDKVEAQIDRCTQQLRDIEDEIDF